MPLNKIIAIITMSGVLTTPANADPYEEHSTIIPSTSVTMNLRPLFLDEVIEDFLAAQPTKAERAVEIAKTHLGVPYVWGGTTPKGFDCSGLVQYCYKQIGINISRTTFTQIHDGIAVDKEDLQIGDLVFFGKYRIHHVGIYIGEGQFIHAPRKGDVVKISFLADRSDYSAARRIVIEE